MHNDWQRLNIWLNLQNKYDYTEFSEACRSENVEPHDLLEFAQKVGMLSVSMSLYPTLPLTEAYLKLIEEGQKIQQIRAQQRQQNIGMENIKSTSAHSCCGGGQVK